MNTFIRKNYFNSTELTLILTPTFECNFSCPYCFKAPNTFIKTSPFYFEALEKYSTRYFKYYRHIELSLFGGEPLLSFKKFQNILSHTKSLSQQYNFSYSTSITTNASLLNKSIINFLLSHNCQSLQITIDGDYKSHNKTRSFKDGAPGFDLLINVINNEINDFLNNDSSTFYLRINLNNNTLNDVNETLLKIRKDIRPKITLILRAVYSTTKYNSHNNNSVRQLKQYYDLASEPGFKISKNIHYNRSCEACCDEKIIYITPDLGMWKCINSMCSPNTKIGQLTSGGTILPNAQNMINWYKASDYFSDNQCKNCKRLPDCFG